MHGFGEIHLVGQHFTVRADHAGELHFAHAERIAAPKPAAPAEVEAGELPEAIQPETAGHDRIAGEVTVKEPQIRRDIELGNDMTLAMRTTVTADFGDAVHHQHRRGGELRVAGTEELASGAFEKVVLVETARVIGHAGRSIHLSLLV